MAGPTSDYDTPPIPTGGGAPENVTSLDVAIGFVTEFNENTAIFAQVVSMLSTMNNMNEFGLPIVTADYGPGYDPLTGEPLQGPMQAPIPVDVVDLQNQVSGLSEKSTTNANNVVALQGEVVSVQSQVGDAAVKAVLADHKAREAISIANRALNRASKFASSSRTISLVPCFR